jgi:hypothetical protein
VLGYAVARQAPNGLIHIIGSMTHPSMAYELNEAWILSDSMEETRISRPLRNVEATQKTQRYPDGRMQATWSGKKDALGRFVLDGTETWYFPGGAKEYEVTWDNGSKRGRESLPDERQGINIRRVAIPGQGVLAAPWMNFPD